MNHREEFRIINEFEKRIINDSIQRISPRIISFLNKLNHEFFISLNKLSSRNKFPSVYLVPKNLINILGKSKPEIMIISIGLYFGFIKRNQLFLSLEAAEFLHEKKIVQDDNYLIVNDNGEKAILYGNHIMKGHAFKIPNSLKKNDLLFILNSKKELISLALSKVNNNSIEDLKSKEIIAQNLIDKGYYLRKKQ